jgi:hypothetical protein
MVRSYVPLHRHLVVWHELDTACLYRVVVLNESIGGFRIRCWRASYFCIDIFPDVSLPATA